MKTISKQLHKGTAIVFLLFAFTLLPSITHAGSCKIDYSGSSSWTNTPSGSFTVRTYATLPSSGGSHGKGNKHPNNYGPSGSVSPEGVAPFRYGSVEPVYSINGGKTIETTNNPTSHRYHSYWWSNNYETTRPSWAGNSGLYKACAADGSTTSAPWPCRRMYECDNYYRIPKGSMSGSWDHKWWTGANRWCKGTFWQDPVDEVGCGYSASCMEQTNIGD